MSDRMRLKDKKRAAILNAAVKTFDGDGFDRTSMDQIAATADVSKRTVYNHFASKEDLFDAIVNQLHSRCSILRFNFDPDRDLERQLIEIGHSYLTLMTSDEFMKLARVVLSRFIQYPEKAGQMLRGHGDTQAAIITWMTAAKKDGNLEIDDPETSAVQFMALMNAFAFWPQLIGGEERPSTSQIEEIVNRTVAMFLCTARNVSYA